MKVILILAGMQTSKIVTFGVQKTRTHTLKSRRTQNESLFGSLSDFGPEATFFFRKAEASKMGAFFYLKVQSFRLIMENNFI